MDTNNIHLQSDGTNVLTVIYSHCEEGQDFWLLLTSDRHHDNINTRWDLEREDLETARQRDAGILDFGDLFCAMQGKFDPRANYDDIRPEHVGQDYLDRLIKTAANFYSPYAANFWLLGKGNHETNITKRHGIDLLQGLAYLLRAEHKSPVTTGGYGGWVHFVFKMMNGGTREYKLKYHHGAGGGGPVTRGVIQTNRQAVYEPDANIVVNGHTHDAWYVALPRERFHRGKVGRDILHFIRTPTYKDEYKNGADGWHIEKWGAPKPLGCAWLRFSILPGGREVSVSVEMTIR